MRHVRMWHWLFLLSVFLVLGFVGAEHAETRAASLAQSAEAQADSPVLLNETPESSSGWRMVGQVGGPTQAVAVQGNYAYVGVGLRLVVLDVSNPITPTEVGSTTPFPYFVEDVVVSGTLAYVAAGGAGLRVVHILTPTAPVEVGFWDSPGYAEGVAVAGSTVYLADGPYGLWTVDVSDPTHPRKVGSAYDMNYAFEVAVSGNHAHIAAAGAGLLVADVSDPAHPLEVGTLDTPGYAYGIAVSGTLAYIADAWEGLRVVDVSNPLSPTLMGVCDTPGWALNVAVAGSIVHVADGADGLRVVDVSDPANPHEVGAYEIPGLARRVAVAGSTAYVADMQGGLRAVDVADPAHPAQVGLYSLLADARRVTVADGYAYMAAGLSGMRVVDIFDPSHPTQVGIYDTGGAYATSVVLSGTYAYLGSGPPNLHVVDISNPAHPTRISAIRTGECREIALAGQIVYCAGEGLQLIDVSDPMAPALVGSILFEAVGVTVSETLAYVAGGGDGVKIVDVSNPVSPTLVGVYDYPGNEFTEGVTVSGNKAYIAEASAGLRIVDVSNPAAPVGIGFYDTPGVPSSVAISGTLAFVSDGGGGVQMVDVSNPITPTLVGAYDTPGFAWYTVVNGDYMYVADGSGGLLILERVDARAFARAGTVPSSSCNGSLASPVLVDITATSVVGTAPAGAMVGIFSDQADEGWVYEGTVTAMASGAFTFIKTGGLTGSSVTATATDVTGNTSEFSALAIAFTTTHVVTSTLDSGPGSLRQALLDASQGDAIIFDPVAFPPASPATISLASQLPFLTQGQLTVDASNAGVLLDGNGTPAGTVGLLVDSDGNTIKGIQVLHFPSSGILLTANASHNTIGGDRTVGIGPTGEGNVISANGPWSGLLIDGSDNIVQGNLVGTDAAGSVAMGNAVCGIQLEVPGNIVGGIAAGRGNVVSGNEVGINIQGTGATSNTIIGNFIGTNISGTLALGNSRGVQIAGRASHNRVGGTTPEERNIISGNDQGVGILGPGVEGNAVVGNYIGTDINGLGALGNNSGVVIECGASHNVVGGRNPGERNVISGNRGAGVVISDLGTTHNTVIGNYIGTDATGTAALGNGGGVLIWTSGFNRVGGTESLERNVISGNGTGIAIGGKEMSDNLVLGNYIGTDVTGARAIPNGTGVSINEGTRHNFVGGASAAEQNVISGNINVGIDIRNAGIEYNWVAGNLIGTDASGSQPLGNFWVGVVLEDYSLHNFVQGNIIAHSPHHGVYVTQSFFDTLRRNSIYSNGERGIVLTDGGNQMFSAPVLFTVTATSISGTACPGCTVEVFSDAEDEGRSYEGSTAADASGAFTFTRAGGLIGPFVTATATDRDGNTSEFSIPQKARARICLPVILKSKL